MTASGAALDEAILGAIATAPKSRRTLIAELKVSAAALGIALARLSKARRVADDGHLIGLPGSLSTASDDGGFQEQARQLWQRRGVLALFIGDVADPILRERLQMIAHERYGRRWPRA